VSKNVLVLSASPRKGGNSDLLCDEFVKGALEAGYQAEKIFVNDKKINYCTGCGACIDRGKGCSQKDDMPEILEKMIAADVIVMATPVYFYTMNGQMKAMIDRTLPRYMEIKKKDFYFIATAAASKRMMERTMEGLKGFTDCLPGAKVKGVIYGAGAWQLGDVQGNTAMDDAYKAGKNI